MKNLNLIVMSLLLGICWGLIGCSASAGDYTIEKVVEIGPADWVPFLGPIRWSPDGTIISYFSQGYLMISDTLGNKRQVIRVDMLPYRYEWLTDTELVISLQSPIDHGTNRRLTRINVMTGQERIIYDKNVDFRDTIDYRAVYLSFEGALYYTQEIITPQHKVEHNFLIAPTDSIIDTAAIMASNHFYRWGEDGLYRIRLDLLDSMRVGAMPYTNLFRVDISPDGKYAIAGGTIERLVDTTYIVLDTLFKEVPESTIVCGFLSPSFSLATPEVALSLSCDYLDERTIDMAGIFNFATNKITVIDHLTGLKGCIAPRFCPNGRHLALISQSKIFIIYRGIK